MALGSDLMLRLLIAAQDRTGEAVGSVRSGIQSITDTARAMWEATKTYLAFEAAQVGLSSLKDAVMKVLETGGQFETYGASLQSLMGGVAEGKQAFSWIKTFAAETPFELNGVTKAFIEMKAFGLDPMDGSLRNVASQTAKIAGGQEELEGIVAALGKAWSAQSLQADSANMLLERGIPVWDMLAKVMGKSTTEIQAMSAAGALGRTEIKLLIDEMGRSSSGALEAQMGTWRGLVSNLSDSWTQFLDSIAESGTLDYFKSKLTEVNAAIVKMVQTGELQAYAGQISQAITGIGSGVATLAGYLIDTGKYWKLAGTYIAEYVVLVEAGFDRLKGGPPVDFAKINADFEMQRAAIRQGTDALDGQTAAAKRTEAAVAALAKATKAGSGLYENATITIRQLDELKTAMVEATAKADELTLAKHQLASGSKEYQAAQLAEKAALAAAQEATQNYETALKSFENGVSTTTTKLNEFITAMGKGPAEWKKFAATVKSEELAAIITDAKTKMEQIGPVIGENTEKMKQWKAAIDMALRESLTRAGVDAEQALTGMSTAVKKRIDELGTMQKTLTASGMEAQKAGKIMVEALSDLATKAKTQEDLQAIREELRKLSEGVTRDMPIYGQLTDAFLKLSEAQAKLKPGVAELAQAQAQAAASADALARKELEGTVTAADYTKAQQDAARAAELLAASGKTAAAATGELTNSQIAANAVMREKMVHNAAVAAQNRQNAEEEKQQAAASAKNAQDGLVQIGNMAIAMESRTVAMNQYGAAAARTWELWNHIDFGTVEAFVRAQDEWLVNAKEQVKYAAKITTELQQATTTGVGLEDALIKTHYSFTLLDDQTLAGLNSAIDAAKQKVQELKNEVISTNEALQEELLQLEGNQQAIEERRYQKQKEKLLQEAELAKSLDQEAQAQAQESLRLAAEIYAKKQAKIREDAAKNPNQTEQASGLSGAYMSLDLVTLNGKKIPTLVGSQFEKDLREVQRQMKVT